MLLQFHRDVMISRLWVNYCDNDQIIKGFSRQDVSVSHRDLEILQMVCQCDILQSAGIYTRITLDRKING